jgi:quercetin dioxygenase-like cupin family protein
MPVHRWSDQPVEQLTPSLGRQLVNTGKMTIARISLAAGAVVPSHEHPQEQVANVLEGRLRFIVGTEEYVVEAGDSVIVPSGVSHRVEALTDSLVLDVFAPVRDDWLRGDDAYLRASG